MNREELKDEFVKLRLCGQTFDAIASKLLVSKQTLINWSKEGQVKETITTAKLTKHQSLLKAYELDRQAKIEYYAELAQKVKKELLNRDLTPLTTDRLFKLMIDCEERLKNLIPTYQFGGEGGISSLLQELEVGPSFHFDPED